MSFVPVRDARGNKWVSGIELYKDISGRSANIPFVLISKTGNDDIVEMALDAGAGVSEVEATMDALDDIAEKIREATTGMEEVANATDDQAASTEEVASMMDKIAEMAEDTADEITEIADANSEQVAEISQLEQSMRQLVEDDQTSRTRELADD